MSLDPETVIIQRATITGDDGGGEEETWAPVGSPPGGWQATRNFYRKTSQVLIDEGQRQPSQGPGVTVKTTCFFTFDTEEQRAPAVARDQYRIIGGDGVAYRILHVRVYDDNIQVDCEAFD